MRPARRTIGPSMVARWPGGRFVWGLGRSEGRFSCTPPASSRNSVDVQKTKAGLEICQARLGIDVDSVESYGTGVAHVVLLLVLYVKVVCVDAPPEWVTTTVYVSLRSKSVGTRAMMSVFDQLRMLSDV
jgi:hypothetical protein